MRNDRHFSRADGSTIDVSARNGTANGVCKPAVNGEHKSTTKQQHRGVPKRHSAKAKSSSDDPNKNWTLEQLTDYVRQHLNDREEMLETLAAIGRNSAIALFRAGHGLHLLRDKLKATSAWEQWLTDRQIGKGTANEAIRLYYKATARWKGRAEVELAKRTITEAKCDLEVIGSKKEKAEATRKPKDAPGRNGKAAEDDLPIEVTRADEYLVAMAHKLEEVVNWDRGDLDANQLDQFARRCIDLLGSFLLHGKKNITKRKNTNVARAAAQ